MFCRMAIAIVGYLMARGRRLVQGVEDAVGVATYDAVPTGLDRLRPLCLVAQRDAGRAVEVGFFLYPARVGEDGGCGLFQPHHVPVIDRLRQAYRVAQWGE